MRLLHLTDLHLTPGSRSREETLDQIWNDATQALGRNERSFDFVVITGDLTQAAADREYDELYTFLARLVTKHVRDGDRARVIMVPGNHDVNWGADCFDPIDKAQLATDEHLRAELREHHRSPHLSTLRTRRDEQGNLSELMRINPQRYPQRFGALQRFFDRFYSDAHTADRRFKLDAEDEQQHWSAHLFPDEKLAFYGFCSCHRNDRNWNGASISHRALEAARNHAEAAAKPEDGWTRIAVWHHGLRSDWSRPDLLSSADLGRLSMLRPALGLHGHTHVGEVADLWETVRYDFPVIATGSFAVSREERLVPNQFSVIELSRSLISWERYEREEFRERSWRRRHEQDVFFSRVPAGRVRRSEWNFSRAKRHRRATTLDDQGIALTTVTLEQVLVDKTLCIAHLRPPYLPGVHDSHAQADASVLPVSTVQESDGSRRYVLQCDEPTWFERIDWQYGSANTFAREARDLVGRRKNKQAEAPPGFDALSQRVDFACGELILELEVQAGTLQNAQARAERRKRGDGHAWEEERAESKRALLAFEPTRARMTVMDPLVGHRYSLLYKPSGDGELLPAKLAKAMKRTIERCRNEMNHGSSAHAGHLIRQQLEQLLEPAMRRALNVPEHGSHPPTRWVAYLWHPDTKQLLPTLGNFPPRDWGSYFGFGEGIVGHSFRRTGPAIHWKSETNDPQDWKQNLRSLLLLTTDQAEGRHVEDHKWIVAVPIQVPSEKQRMAVGVIGFADFHGHAQEGVNEALRVIASEVVDAPADAPEDERLKELIRQLSLTFWYALINIPALSEGDLAYTRDLLGDWLRESSPTLPVQRKPVSSPPLADRRRDQRYANADGLEALVHCSVCGDLPRKVKDSSAHGVALDEPLCCFGVGASLELSWLEQRREGKVLYACDRATGIFVKDEWKPTRRRR